MSNTISLQDNKAIPYYIRGNVNFPNGVINQLLLLGGKVDGGFNESELANPRNIFYINYLNDNYIFKCIDNSITGELIVSAWTELYPLTYIDEPESLPKSWSEALEKCHEAQVYQNAQNTDFMIRLDVLGKLAVLRDIYRQGWQPDPDKFCFFIKNEFGHIDVTRGIGTNHFLSFQEIDLAEKFKTNFVELILHCGDLI